MTRAVWFQGRFQYWSRKAVADLSRNELHAGPGIVFVPGAFVPDQAAFAPQSLFWQDYTNPTGDPARAQRITKTPRYRSYQDLVNLLGSLPRSESATNRAPTVASAAALLNKIDGPRSLRDNLNAYLASPSAVDSLKESQKDEIHRIQHSMIASLFHPNAAGANAYAASAVARYRGHLQMADRVAAEVQGSAAQRQADGRVAAALPGVVAPPSLVTPTLDSILRHYRLRTAGPLSADVGHFDVDSIALVVRTHPSSSVNLGESAHLTVTTMINSLAGSWDYLLTGVNYVDPRDLSSIPPDNQPRQQRQDDGGSSSPSGGAPPRIYPINKPYPFLEPGATNRFTVDTIGRLRLDHITGFAIRLGPDPYANAANHLGLRAFYGVDWYTLWVQLQINGVPVSELDLLGVRVGPGGHVDLNYPGPVQPTTMRMLKVPRASQVRGGRLGPSKPRNLAKRRVRIGPDE